MAKNSGLSKAKNAKKDEFYTSYEVIQAEINHYEDKFKIKPYYVTVMIRLRVISVNFLRNSII